jgi:hypothetical protein
METFVTDHDSGLVNLTQREIQQQEKWHFFLWLEYSVPLLSNVYEAGKYSFQKGVPYLHGR